MASGSILVLIRNSGILFIYKLPCFSFQAGNLHIICIQLFTTFFPNCFQITVYITQCIHLFP